LGSSVYLENWPFLMVTLISIIALYAGINSEIVLIALSGELLNVLPASKNDSPMNQSAGNLNDKKGTSETTRAIS